jgi:hypothetical protein
MTNPVPLKQVAEGPRTELMHCRKHAPIRSIELLGAMDSSAECLQSQSLSDRSKAKFRPALLTVSIGVENGRALRANIADRNQHFVNGRDGAFRRDAVRRMLTGDGECPLASMRIRTFLHPAVLFAFVDGAHFLQHRDRSALQRPDRRSSLLKNQH